MHDAEQTPFDVFDDPRGEDFTVGVEEEFFVVDAATGALRHDAAEIVDRGRAPLGHVIDHELKRSQAETGTAVCRDIGEVRSSVTELRRRLGTAAREVGARLVASGTLLDERGEWEDVSAVLTFIEREGTRARSPVPGEGGLAAVVTSLADATDPDAA